MSPSPGRAFRLAATPLRHRRMNAVGAAESECGRELRATRGLSSRYRMLQMEAPPVVAEGIDLLDEELLPEGCCSSQHSKMTYAAARMGFDSMFEAGLRASDINDKRVSIETAYVPVIV